MFCIVLFLSIAGLDTNGCPLGNSKFILLSDNLNICLWLSACQVEKINQIDNSWSTIYQRLSQPEVTFRKCKKKIDLQCTHSCKFYLFHLCSKGNKEWLTATLAPSMADLLLMPWNVFSWLITMSWQLPGPRLNIKTVLSTYGDFHVKDKTAVRTSYL